MADPFVAEIRIFPFTFAPRGWAFCNGQLLPISQNTALFSLLGTFYGGNGQSNFALPNLQGNGPIHQGQGAGLSERFLGETGGTSFVTLLTSEIPAHNHTANCATSNALTPDPVGNTWANQAQQRPYSNQPPLVNGSPVTTMSFQAMSVTGGGLPHNNMPPYLTLNFCIALQGVFPPRS